MIGMFRAIADGRPRFYELIALDADGEAVVCRFRHFNRDLTGWEEKDAPPGARSGGAHRAGRGLRFAAARSGG